MNRNPKPLILIVDDTPDNIRVLCGILESDYEIVVAQNGEMALDMVSDTQPDLILLDVTMPDLDGYEVCRRLKYDPKTKTIPVIFMTPESDHDDIVTGFRTGGVDYLCKPFIQEELLARVAVHLKLQHLIKELELKNRELSRLAETDSLTGIYNRRAFIHHLDETLKLAVRHQFSVTLLMLDIDFFKKINDTYGHLTGDAVIASVSATIRHNIRKTDFMGRFGGEEFIVCFPHTDLSSGITVAEKVRAHIEGQSWPEHPFRITLSGGLAVTTGNETTDKLIARADAMLYQAKETGRNRICAGL